MITGNIYKWKAHKLRASFNKPDQLLSDGDGKYVLWESEFHISENHPPSTIH